MTKTKKPKKATALHQKIAKQAVKTATTKQRYTIKQKFIYGIGVAVWVFASFALAQVLLAGFMYLLRYLHIPLPIHNTTVLETIFAVLVYVLALVIAIGVPFWLKKYRTTLGEVGLAQTLPSWRDILLSPAVFIVAIITTGGAMLLLQSLGLSETLNLTQRQSVGFQFMTQNYELMLAYFTLAVLAPFAEELLFRGYMFGKLRKRLSAVATILLSAFLFGLLHLPGITESGVQLQWNVVIDTFILAIFLGVLREFTGSIWAGILVHMIKNSLAFFLLFIAPLIWPGFNLIQ